MDFQLILRKKFALQSYYWYILILNWNKVLFLNAIFVITSLRTRQEIEENNLG